MNEIHEHLESLYPDTSRFEEIQKIITVVKEGASCQLIGMPGVGRGNVCKFLAYNHNIRVKHLGKEQTSFHFVFVNFAEVKNRPLFDVMKFIFLELVSSLHERKFSAYEAVDAMFKKALSYKDELVLFEGLKSAIEYLVFEEKLHIIFLFERFELYIPHLTDSFFVNLRSLRDRVKYKFSVVFSVTRPLEDCIEMGIMADFYEFFAQHQIYLSLCDKPGIDFRINYLEQVTQKTLDKKLITEVLRLTAGHGKLTRLSIEALLANSVILSETKNLPSKEDPSALPQDDRAEKMLLSQKSIIAGVKEIWEFLTPEEQSFVILNEVKNLPSKEDPSALPQDDSSRNFLGKAGILHNNQISIPLFAAFMEAQQIQKQSVPLTITFNEATNTITKGDLVLSEKLTSAEFRLLRFLLLNQNRVIEREEIITSVWKDLASTVGVTEQALDQLLFRLRKKIEENPNQPTHIETIKGRGIRFTN